MKDEKGNAMKMMIPLAETPDPKFDDVARLIAKGDPPEWLVLGLTQFSGGIWPPTSNEERRFADTQIERMQDAVHVLMTGLPIWENLGFGVGCPAEVVVALGVLPKIKADLDLLATAKNQIGRRPDVGREVCAAVVVEAWKMIHGRPNARTEKLYQACRDYWWACGGRGEAGSDDVRKWRRTVESALKNNHLWIKDILSALAARNSP